MKRLIFHSTDSLAGSFCQIFVPEATSFWLGVSVVVNISQNLITGRTALLYRRVCCGSLALSTATERKPGMWDWWRLQFREHWTFFFRRHCPSSVKENNFVLLVTVSKMISNMYTLQLFYYIVLSDESRRTSRALTAIITISFFPTGS